MALTLALCAGIFSEEAYRSRLDPDNLELAWFGRGGVEPQDVAYIQDHVGSWGGGRLPTDVILRSSEGHVARVRHETVTGRLYGHGFNLGLSEVVSSSSPAFAKTVGGGAKVRAWLAVGCSAGYCTFVFR